MRIRLIAFISTVLAVLLTASQAWGDGAEVYRRVAPSTVQILPTNLSFTCGTGTLVDVENRLILTADHVVEGITSDARHEVTVIFPQYDSKARIITELSYYRERHRTLSITGKVVLRDAKRDLALIHLPSLPAGVAAVPLATRDPEPGDNVHVIGMSSGKHGGVYGYCAGSVRNVFHWRRFGNPYSLHIVAHHAPTNKGDSGGPVLNDRGEIIAVVSSGTIGEPSNPGEWTYQQQVVDHSIHVSEIRVLLNRYRDATTLTPAIQSLIDQLRDPNVMVRLQAAKMLGQHGAAARGAIPALESLAGDRDADVRSVAANAIRRIEQASENVHGAGGNGLKPILPANHSGRHIVFVIAEVPLQTDPNQIPQLIDSLKNPNAAVRLGAAKELGRLGAAARPAIPALQAALQDADEDVRLVAANSLRAIQASAPAGDVQKLMADLRDADAVVRLIAAKKLGTMGAAARDALSELQKLLQDPDADVRRVAENSIQSIQAAAPTTTPNQPLQKLLADLQSPEALTRMIAAKELGKLGPAARDALPALQRLVQDPDEDVRRVAGNAIASIQGTTPPTQQPAGSVAGTRWSGSESLAGFGKLAFEFHTDGKAVMIDAKSQVNGSWAQTGNEVTITFQNCVYKGTIQGNAMTGNAQYTQGPHWTFSLTRDEGVPTNTRVLARFAYRDGTATGPASAVTSTRVIKFQTAGLHAQTDPNVQCLINDLRSPDAIVRLRAAKQLGTMGAAARDAIAGLSRLTQDPDPDVRRVAANALQAIQATSPPAPNQQPYPPAAGSEIDDIGLKSMVENLGYVVDTRNSDAGTPRYHITLRRGTWTLPTVVELSGSKQYLWVSIYLTRLPADTANRGTEFLRLLQKNFDIAPAFFAHEVRNNQLFVQRAMENQNVTAARLRQVIDAVADAAVNNVALWQPFTAGGTPQPPSVTPPTIPPTVDGSVAGTVWEGSENLSGFGRLTFRFESSGKALMIDAQSTVNGNWTQQGNQVTITFENCVYQGNIAGNVLSGNARYTSGSSTTWTFNVSRSGVIAHVASADRKAIPS